MPRYFCYSLIVLCCLTAFSASAQRNKSAILQHDAEPHDGTVLLTNGEELRGGIIFNDNEGIVTVVNDSDSRSFNARRIVKFEFWHDEARRYIRFYSLEFTDPETGVNDMDFFEVLKELESFAVLVRIERIRTVERSGRHSGPATPLISDRSSRKLVQSQTIYFLSPEGDFEPYVEILEKEIAGGVLDLNEKNRFYINSKLFEKYTGKHYDALKAFAKENDLSFKRKSDIITLLDEYERLSGL